MSGPPKKVFVIRHCDKPDDDTDIKCNSYGYKRSYLLAGISGPCDGEKTDSVYCNNKCQLPLAHTTTSYWSIVLEGEKPTKLLAAVSKYDKDKDYNKDSIKDCSKSNRCCLILNPTSAVYGLNINNKNENFCDTQGKDMADYILTKSDPNDIIIVAWEHNNIPTLINRLGVSPQLGDWPKKSNDRFDLVFEIDFSNDSSSPSLTILTQNLKPNLPGDNDNDDPFKYNKKKNNFLRTIQRHSHKNKNNIKKIIIISVGIILFITLICIIIHFIRKSAKK